MPLNICKKFYTFSDLIQHSQVNIIYLQLDQSKYNNLKLHICQDPVIPMYHFGI